MDRFQIIRIIHDYMSRKPVLKAWIFEQETKTRKSCQQVMLTTYGLAKNQYSSIIQRELTMEDLFH